MTKTVPAAILGTLMLGTAWAQDRTPEADIVEPDRDEHNSHLGDANTQAAAVIGAIDLDSTTVDVVSFGTSSHAGFDVFNMATEAYGGFPRAGSTYLVMSSGNTSSTGLPNNSGSTSTTLGGLNQSQGNDLVQMVMIATPPAGATSLSFDWKFFSEEFPEWVGTPFNDAFLVESPVSNFTISGISTITAPNNVAFDGAGNPITINTTGALGMSAAEAAGTTYDGATQTLRTIAPFTKDGAGQVTFVFSVMDLGDSIYDTTVFLDNFVWGDDEGNPTTGPANEPPVADAGGPYSAECQGVQTAIQLDGSGSSDPDGDAITYLWTSDCPSASFSDPTSQMPVLTVDSTSLPLLCNVTLTVNDGNNPGVSQSTTVTVGDSTPPVVTCHIAQDQLWPPNHKLVPVGLVVDVADDCDANVGQSVQVTVWCDETEVPDPGDGSGNHAPDAKGDGGLRLRAERRGTEDGRVYLIIATATDASGNSSSSYCTVTVSHSKSAASQASVAAQAAAALATAVTDGAAPADFVQIGLSAAIGPHQ